MIMFIFRFLDQRYQAPSHVPVNSWTVETVQGDVEGATFCTSNRPLSHILTGSIPSDSASLLVGTVARIAQVLDHKTRTMGVELDVFHQDPCEIGPPTLRAGARNPGATPSQSSGRSASTSTLVWLPRRLDVSPRRVTSRISTGEGGRVTCDQDICGPQRTRRRRIRKSRTGTATPDRRELLNHTAGNAGASVSRRIGLHVVCLLVDHNTGTARVEQ